MSEHRPSALSRQPGASIICSRCVNLRTRARKSQAHAAGRMRQAVCGCQNRKRVAAARGEPDAVSQMRWPDTVARMGRGLQPHAASQMRWPELEADLPAATASIRSARSRSVGSVNPNSDRRGSTRINADGMHPNSDERGLDRPELDEFQLDEPGRHQPIEPNTMNPISERRIQ